MRSIGIVSGEVIVAKQVFLQTPQGTLVDRGSNLSPE